MLVGINADEFATQIQDISLNPHNKDKKESLEKAFRDRFYAQQARDLNKAEYNLAVEQSVQALIDAIRSGKLQIRIVKDHSTHAKFYIFTSTPTLSHTTQQRRYNGSLIVGSSNLSQSGLSKNYEFNLESRDSDDIAYALCEFYELWKEAIPLTNEPKSSADKLEKALKEQSYLKECSVKEIYYKLLIEYFGINKIKVDSSLKSFFPRDFKKPDYQLTAIAEGLDKLEKYNGFFLSDVVGLGKTLIACIVAKKFESEDENFKSLIVCPAALTQTWEEHLELVRLNHRKIVSYDKSKEIKNPQDYSLIIIDESHNLAHTATNRYKNLEQICKELTPKGTRKKVILLSATPQKNSPKDIESQLCLFQNRRDCNIENIDNLEAFFAPLKRQFQNIKEKLESAFKKSDSKEQIKRLKNELKGISKKIRDELLRFVMVRRTRADILGIESFAKNLEEQGIRFPEISSPSELIYKLGDKARDLAKNTLYLLNEENNAIGHFGYYRYLVYPNLTPKGKEEFESKYDDKINFTQTAQRLATLMQIIMFKRFESSIEAFKSTLQAQIKSIKAFLAMFDKGKIHIPRNLANLNKFYDDILNDESDIEKYIEKGNVFTLSKSDFLPNYEAHLKSDLATLELLLAKWQEIKEDTKLDKLKEKLKTFENSKVIIFTEAKASADYLKKHIKNALKIDASNRDKNEDIIRENFDANHNIKNNDYNVLISTDTLAEGINLHRSNIIINYDSPWSATKLMQRIGRINRIGTPHTKIYIYNFKPSDLGDAILGFNAKAFQKLQSFHFTFGEDSAIYDDSEEFGTQKLFESTIHNEQSEVSDDTEFLADIKRLYANNPNEFERINALAPKSRTFLRKNDAKCFCYLKNVMGNNYFYAISGKNCDKSDFLAMARYLKSHINDKAHKPSNDELARHYSDIASIEGFHKGHIEENRLFDEVQTFMPPKNPNVRKAHQKIQHATQFLSNDEISTILRVIDKGVFANLHRDILNAKTKEDYQAIYAKSQNKEPEKNRDSKQDKIAQIKLSISTFEIDIKDKK